MLPADTQRKDSKTFEELTVPPAKRRPPMTGERRVPVSALNDVGRLAFKGYETLNRIQSIVFDTAYTTNHNLLICAPTGAGKTNIAMLTVLRCIEQVRLLVFCASVSVSVSVCVCVCVRACLRAYLRISLSLSLSLSLAHVRFFACTPSPQHIDQGVVQKDQFKIVYIAPMKALAAEMTETFGRRSVRRKEIKRFTPPTHTLTDSHAHSLSQIKSNQTKSNQTKPNQTKPNQLNIQRNLLLLHPPPSSLTCSQARTPEPVCARVDR